MPGKWGDGSDGRDLGGGTADQQEGNGDKRHPDASQGTFNRLRRMSSLARFTSYDGSSLAGFDALGLGATPGTLDEKGTVLGNPNLIYENGNLMVRTDMIDAFTGIFKGQNEAAKAKAASFLAQDTILTGASSSKKGTVLGGVI